MVECPFLTDPCILREERFCTALKSTQFRSGKCSFRKESKWRIEAKKTEGGEFVYRVARDNRFGTSEVFGEYPRKVEAVSVLYTLTHIDDDGKEGELL